MKKYLIILSFLSVIHMQYFNVEIDETGESTLFIFQDSITYLEIGDELGLFDASGINVNGENEEVLVGTGEWDGLQLSIAAITSVDLSAFGGPTLPGAIYGHPMLLKVWDSSLMLESNVTYDILSGTGTFNGLFTAISEINSCDLSEGYCDCEGNVLDACGVCGGVGAIYECGCSDILEGACDCDNNFLDCAGICGGSSVVDDCDICNGPGAIYECGCYDIPEGECDCASNIFDECGCCGGPGLPDGYCACESECGANDWQTDLGCGCGEPAPSGCDETCGSILENDECGVCDGPGAIYECGCYDILEGACDCLGNTEDCLGNCGGNAAIDECGVCGGPGATIWCDWYSIYVCSEDDCYDGGTGTEGVDYESEIEPILMENCITCHSYGGGYSGGLDLTSYEDLMDGGYSGSAIYPGYSSASLLIQKLNGTASGAQMPADADPLDDDTINLISLWIDEGAIGPDNSNDGDGCNTGEIVDCNGNCFNENLLENGICNDGSNGSPDFNCTALYFDGDCFNNFDNCSPDCPVGILEFGNINVNIEENLIVGELEIIMNCQFNVSEFNIELSEDFNITQITSGTVLDGAFNVDYNENVVFASSNETSLISGEQTILVLHFEMTGNEICFDSSNITTTIGIQYGAVLGDCVPISSYLFGWNWISINQSFDDMSIDYVFSSLGENARFIKNQSGYADYYAGFGWFGTLETLDNISMYKLEMLNDDAIAYRGNYVNVDEVLFSLPAGWNWIGYTPKMTLDINVALSNIPDGNAEFLKSQSGYADYYSGFGWFGTLENMDPFIGYLFRLVEDTDFIYNDEDGLGKKSSSMHSQLSYDQFDLNIHDYEHNGTMTTALYIDDDRVDSYDYILAAYDGMTCVGYTEGLYFPLDGNVIFPLMVYGNDEGHTLTFKVYDKLSNTYLDIDKELIFTPDMQLGDGSDPVVLNNSSIPNEVFLKSVYPNPFNPSTEIVYILDDNMNIEISIYDLKGRLIDNLIDQNQSKGEYSIVWSPNNLSSGIYFLQLKANHYLATHKLILLK